MGLKLASLTLCMLHLAVALPANLLTAPKVETLLTIEDMESSDDTMAVGSYIRETRAAPETEQDHFKSNEHEGNGEIGYSRKKSGGGQRGYQHFDSFHKKAGDNYEFEKQDSYGLEEKEQDGAYSHQHERRAKRERDSEEKERYREPEELDDEDEERDSKQKNQKQQEPEEVHGHAELREGAPDGNGGVEAYGHDPNDYILPEKYTYGKEAEDDH